MKKLHLIGMIAPLLHWQPATAAATELLWLPGTETVTTVNDGPVLMGSFNKCNPDFRTAWSTGPTLEYTVRAPGLALDDLNYSFYQGYRYADGRYDDLSRLNASYTVVPQSPGMWSLIVRVPTGGVSGSNCLAGIRVRWAEHTTGSPPTQNPDALAELNRLGATCYSTAASYPIRIEDAYGGVLSGTMHASSATTCAIPSIAIKNETTNVLNCKIGNECAVDIVTTVTGNRSGALVPLRYQLTQCSNCSGELDGTGGGEKDETVVLGHDGIKTTVTRVRVVNNKGYAGTATAVVVITAEHV